MRRYLLPISTIAIVILFVASYLAMVYTAGRDSGKQIGPTTWKIAAGYTNRDTHFSVLEENMANFQEAHPDLEIIYTTTTAPDAFGWMYCLLTVKKQPAEARP